MAASAGNVRTSTRRRSTRLQSQGGLSTSFAASSTVFNLASQGNATAGSLTARSLGEQASRRAATKERSQRKRGATKEAVSISGHFDSMAEHVVVKTIEQPCCLQACLDQPRCQRACFPAEYATRNRRMQGGAEESKGLGRQRQQEGLEQRHFGFPDFSGIGFTVVQQSEAGWVDPLVPERLGLCLLTHRKTSLQRFCLIVEKARLPADTTAQDLQTLVRGLRRCEHVNVLDFQDLYEDGGALYFTYEEFPCCTLQSQLETAVWTQEQMVNIARECCAAAAHTSTLGLVHLGWTLCHVLLPAEAATGGDPTCCKVFGFGLMGAVQVDSHDHLLWAPEGLERFNQQGGALANFVNKMEGQLRIDCDCWSLGAIAYALVHRQLPARSEEDVLAKRWSFTLAIDDVDSEARSLVEGLLHPVPDRRLRAERALHQEWVRKRYRAPPGGTKVFIKLEEFCSSSLPKRLFGRFLTRFLGAEHMREISLSLYTLDIGGNGLITLKELQTAAKSAGRPDSVAKAIHEWLAREGSQSVCLTRFAEALAEDVIDGRALRHAFESLDDDGSEQISAEELFQALRAFDGSLTLQEVVAHIQAAELEVGDGATAQDHQIDYNEFVRLFPVRLKRMQALDERLRTSRETSQDLTERFRSSGEERHEWIKALTRLLKMIQDLRKAIGKSEDHNDNVRALRKHVASIDHGLKSPPGPTEVNVAVLQAKVNRQAQRRDVYGFDTFMQDLACQQEWSTLVSPELKMLKQAITVEGKFAGASHQFKAHDAVEGVCVKVGDLLESAGGQIEEYEAFVEALDEPEVCMTGIAFSGRGLRARSGESTEDEPGMEAAVGDGDGFGGNVMLRFMHEVTARFTSR